MSTVQPILSVDVRYENDVVAARQRARQIATLLGFDLQDQTRIATAVSEMARNAFQYAHGGLVQFQVEGRSPQRFVITVRDNGRGIDPDIKEKIFSPFCTTKPRGMGLGLPIVKRTVFDHHGRVDVDSTSKGTLVSVLLPATTPAD
jgi:signal transduction histidine kinase